MTPKRSRLTFAAVITFIVGLIVFFPARIAYHWFVPDGVSISGISGSTWYGSAREASANGIYLRDLRWRIRPVTLLTGKLGYAIGASPASGFVEGNLAISVTGTLSVTDLNGSLPLQSLQRALGIPGLRGNLSVQLSTLIIEDGLPVAADGVVEVANLLAPAVYRASIGGYRAEFSTVDDEVVASVEDTDGVFYIAGDVRVAADRSYGFVALLAPKPNTPRELQDQLRFLGSANDRGQYELRLEGKL